MPYIPRYERARIDPAIDALIEALGTLRVGSMAGYLNYTLTRLVQGTLLNEPSYLQIATATGVLENVKQEMYRRLAAPYEDKKALENGDVYPCVPLPDSDLDGQAWADTHPGLGR